MAYRSENGCDTWVKVRGGGIVLARGSETAGFGVNITYGVHTTPRCKGNIRESLQQGMPRVGICEAYCCFCVFNSRS